jgi:hypothetical protein
MAHILEGLVSLVLSLLTGIENSLGSAMETTGMTPNVEAVFWGVIIKLCLAVVIRLLSGWIRTAMLLLIVGLALHAFFTHGFGTLA